MLENSKIIIPDTRCPILLDKIYGLDILELVAKKIFITPEIHKEFGKTLYVSRSIGS
jgi:hypothetical protein